MEKSKKIKHILISILLFIVIMLIPNLVQAAPAALKYNHKLTNIDEKSALAVYYTMRQYREAKSLDWITADNSGEAVPSGWSWETEWGVWHSDTTEIEKKYIFGLKDHPSDDMRVKMIGLMCWSHPMHNNGSAKLKLIGLYSGKLEAGKVDPSSKVDQLLYVAYKSSENGETGYAENAKYKYEIDKWLAKYSNAGAISEGATGTFQVGEEGKEYLSNLNSKFASGKKDNKGKKIKTTVSTTKVSNKNYIVIGPINVVNSIGTISSFQCLNANGKPCDGAGKKVDEKSSYHYKYAYTDKATVETGNGDNALKTLDKNKITSGEIYLYVQWSSGNGISKVRLNRTYDAVASKVVVWEERNSDQQNICVFDGRKYSTTDYIDVDVVVDDPISASLEITKLGSISREPVVGATFLFHKFVKVTDDSDAKGAVFFQNGKVTKAGSNAEYPDYYPIETDNSNNGYKYVGPCYNGSNGAYNKASSYQVAYKKNAEGKKEKKAMYPVRTQAHTVTESETSKYKKGVDDKGNTTYYAKDETVTYYYFSPNYYTNAADRGNWKESDGTAYKFGGTNRDDEDTNLAKGTGSGQSNAGSGHGGLPYVKCDLYKCYLYNNKAQLVDKVGTYDKDQLVALDAYARGDFYWRPMYARQFLQTKLTNNQYSWGNVSYSTAKDSNDYIWTTKSDGTINMSKVEVPTDGSKIRIWATELNAPSGYTKIDGKKGYNGYVYQTAAIPVSQLNNGQNEKKADKSEVYKTLEDEETTVTLTIRKVGSDDQTYRVKGAKFIVYMPDYKKWVLQNSNGTVSYTESRSTAVSRAYETGSGGEIYIQGLVRGTYEVEEVGTTTGTDAQKYYYMLDGSIRVDLTSNLVKVITEPARTGTLIIDKVDAINNNLKVDGAAFRFYNQRLRKWVKSTGTESVTYVSNESQATTYTTQNGGRIYQGGLVIGDYTMKEIPEKCSDTVRKYWQTNINKTITITEQKYIIKQTTDANGNVKTETVENKQVVPEGELYGNLTLVKQDSINAKSLNGFGFKFYNKTKKVWVSKNANGQIEYKGTEGEVRDLIAGQDGETKGDGKIVLKNIIAGEYQIYETIIPDNHFIPMKTITLGNKTVGDGGTVVIQNNSLTQKIYVSNKRAYIDIAGYVWEDNANIVNGTKKQDFDNLYNASTADKRKNNVKVSLKYQSGNKTITAKDKNGKECVLNATGSDGTYRFNMIPVETIEHNQCYLEFTYDGLTYTSVKLNVNATNGSKAEENASERNGFNSRFAIIQGHSDKDKSTVSPGNPKQLQYTLKGQNIGNGQQSSELNTAELKNDGSNTINSYTSKDYIVMQWKKVRDDTINTLIDNVNLGLVKRDQPDMQLVNDLQNVRVTVNGSHHVYKYGTFKLDTGVKSPGSVGVAFEYMYNPSLSYKRYIYEADVIFGKDNPDKFSVRMVYGINLANTTTLIKEENLKTQINSIVDYYDNRYTIVKVGTEINNNGEITKEISNWNLGNGPATEEGWRSAIINTSSLGKIDANKSKMLYIEFDVGASAIYDMITARADNLMKHTAEIYSYSVFDKNDKQYAGIDVDSNPGNWKTSDIKGLDKSKYSTTFQDDTSRGIDLVIDKADAREISGNVFLDSIDEDKLEDNIRTGDGEYKDGEKSIKDIEVKLYNANAGGNAIGAPIQTATTDGNGNYNISDFIPGNYVLKYTWGGKEYTLSDGNKLKITVEKYKNTIYKEKDRTSNNYWYRDETHRYSDALDNEATRKTIDDGLQEIDYSKKQEIAESSRTMDSSTPLMKIEIENQENNFTDNRELTKDQLAENYKDYKNEMKNVDFGIVERPKQELELEKRLSKIKLTAADNKVLVDAEIPETSNLPETPYLTHAHNSSNIRGFAEIQLDTSLMQGATLEATYEYKIKNNSEIDYKTRNFYYYGEEPADSEKAAKIVKLTASEMIDYLDNSWAYTSEEVKQYGAAGAQKWQLVTEENITGKLKQELVESSDIKTKYTRLYTDEFSGTILRPNEETNKVTLKVSRLLSTTDKDTQYKNQAEIIKVLREEIQSGEMSNGSDLTSTPGNYDPVEVEQNALTPDKTEVDDDMAERISITPNQGANKEYTIPIIIGVVALAIIATGVIIINKKILRKK